MHGRNCKLIVVKPAKRKGYMPCNVMVSTPEEAQRCGAPIEEQIVAWGERERA
jgi:hypothetical protein